MGKDRYAKLLKNIPGNTNILCIDEQTACVFDPKAKEITVMGKGGAEICREDKITRYNSGNKFKFSQLT